MNITFQPATEMRPWGGVNFVRLYSEETEIATIPIENIPDINTGDTLEMDLKFDLGNGVFDDGLRFRERRPAMNDSLGVCPFCGEEVREISTYTRRNKKGKTHQRTTTTWRCGTTKLYSDRKVKGPRIVVGRDCMVVPTSQT